MDTKKLYPNEHLNNICYIKNIIQNPNIEVGDYTYYNCSKDVESFERECVQYHYPELKDKLIIDKFSYIDENVHFIMNAANHNLDAITTYPLILGSDIHKLEEQCL